MITRFLLYFAVVRMYIKICCVREENGGLLNESGAHCTWLCTAKYWKHNYARWVKNHLNGATGAQWTIWRCLITSAASASLLLHARLLALCIFLLIRVIPLLSPSPGCKPKCKRELGMKQLYTATLSQQMKFCINLIVFNTINNTYYWKWKNV